MTHKQKVLIVDDEPRNQRIMAETLEGVVDFEIASSGEEALVFIDRDAPDLVLLDIMMPGIDGYEVCKNIRGNAKLAFTKVILVSGKAMIEERLKGYEVGADEYMTKPFISEELLAKAKVFLRLALLERVLTESNRDLDEKVRERGQQLLDTEAKLVNAAKMSALGEMAGGIAHEINTPLATISLLVDELKDFMSEKKLDLEAMAEITQKISKTVQRIGSIISGLRTFSRDGSKDPLELTALWQIVENTLLLCKEKIKHSEIRLMCDGIDRDIQVNCRPVQLSQVLLNLIGNSCDAVSQLSEKWISISATKSDQLVEILVTDSGSGVSENIRDKLFQPFFTTKEIGKGTGLGLSISKGIVEGHKGSLELDAKCKNTRFVLHLPCGVAQSGASIKKAA